MGSHNKQSNPSPRYVLFPEADLLKAEGDKEVEGITEMNQIRDVGPEHFSLQLCS